MQDLNTKPRTITGRNIRQEVRRQVAVREGGVVRMVFAPRVGHRRYPTGARAIFVHFVATRPGTRPQHFTAEYLVPADGQPGVLDVRPRR
jgi:hypothetical protein